MSGPVSPAPTATVPRPRPAPGELAPRVGAAGPATRIRSQAISDLRSYLRNGEQLLLTLVLPAMILVGAARTDVPDVGATGPTRLSLLVAGTFALAVVSTSFTGQAIGTGFDRRYGVLRLLAATPLGRDGLLGGRIVAVLLVELVQLGVLGAVGALLGWRPAFPAVGAAATALVLGTAAFVALGLLLAGTLRAEAVLAAANLIWVLLVAAGGLLVPLDRLGAWGDVLRWLPSGALGEAWRAAVVDGDWAWGACGVLVVWSAAGAWAVARWFRWE